MQTTGNSQSYNAKAPGFSKKIPVSLTQAPRLIAEVSRSQCRSRETKQIYRTSQKLLLTKAEIPVLGSFAAASFISKTAHCKCSLVSNLLYKSVESKSLDTNKLFCVPKSCLCESYGSFLLCASIAKEFLKTSRKFYSPT